MAVFSTSCFMSLIVTRSVHENLPLYISELIPPYSHLVLSDRLAGHFLMLLGPRTVRQNDMAGEPSDLSHLRSGMPCPGASRRQTQFILSGPLSRRTSSFIACNSTSHLSLLCVRACANLLCYFRCAHVKLCSSFSPIPAL